MTRRLSDLIEINEAEGNHNMSCSGRILSIFFIILLQLLPVRAEISKAKDNKAMAHDDFLKVHYHRFSGDYQNWQLWVWTQGANNGKVVLPSEEDDYGMIFKVNLSEISEKPDLSLNGQKTKSPRILGLLPRLGEWLDKDNPERWLEKYKIESDQEIWLISDDPVIYRSKPEITPGILRALAENDETLTLVLTSLQNKTIPSATVSILDQQGEVAALSSGPPKIKEGKSHYPMISVPFRGLSKTRLNRPDMTVELPGYGKAPLWFRSYYINDTYCTDEPMGCFSTDKEILFRLFAPQAWRVSLNIYPESNRKGAKSRREMRAMTNGIWQTSIPISEADAFYTFTVWDNYGTREFTDPCAALVTSEGKDAKIKPLGSIRNSKSPAVAKSALTGQENSWPLGKPTDLIIYELHLRDFTIDSNSGVSAKGKYLGLSETGTSLENHGDLSTGLDHLTELGINAVQIMPFQNFQGPSDEGEYNWGYMPVHYNSPELWYSSSRDPQVASREIREMVKALHNKGILVIMDVVYNHTSEGSLQQTVNFNGAFPGYYYRTWEDGSLANGSGCGNEFHSEAPMAQKFIIHSMSYWIREYDVDGFRMDLMGLTDCDTLASMAAELRKIKPGLILYGEPWAAGESPLPPFSKGMQKKMDIAVFNDHFRDSLRGSVWNQERGFITSLGNRKFIPMDTLKSIVKGSIDLFTANPMETINYVAVHDNRTLRDRIEWTMAGTASADQEKMARLAMAVLITSQGVPLIHSGMEMFRTKGGEHNSYNRPDSVNMIDWKLKKTHLNTFRFLRDIIAMRKEHPLFRQTDPLAIEKNIRFAEKAGIELPDNCLGWSISAEGTDDIWKEVIVIINPCRKKVKVTLPERGEFTAAVLGDWSGGGLGETPGIKVPSNLEIPSLSAAILFR